MVRKVEVVPHDTSWSRVFQAEAERLAQVYGQEMVAVHHIGSTAIPGISAKPIIDILVEVREIEKVDRFNADMVALGYQPMGEFGIPRRRFFVKGGDASRTHHVHVFQVGDLEITRHLDFKAYMFAHPEAAQAYGRLKEELARQFPGDIEGYTAGKDEFIKRMDMEAKAWRESLEE